MQPSIGSGWCGTRRRSSILPRNDYKPDVCFFSPEKSSAFTPQQWPFPAPEFIAELAAESFWTDPLCNFGAVYTSFL